MSIFISFIILFLGAVLSFFVFWKFLKDDCEDAGIFSLGLLILVGGLLGYWVAQWVLGEDALLGALIIALLLGFLRARRLKMRIVEVLEAGVPAILVFLLFFSLMRIFSYGGWQMVVEPIILILTLLLFTFFRRNYRKFLWYPSGRPGFASLATVAFYFFVRSLIAIFAPVVLFLISRSTSIVLGLAFGIASLVMLYFQSGREIKTDLAGFWRIFKR